MAKQKAPEGETPEQRFTRVATVRVSSVLYSLEVLSHMGGDVPDQAAHDAVWSAIDAAVAKARNAWTAKQTAEKKRLFSFGGDNGGKQAQLPHTGAKPAPAQARK